jgi:CheY-like chemotaxis protein
MRPINIFIIDDDKLFVFLTKKTIGATQIATSIKEFGDGEEAINYLRQSCGRTELLPDIIMLDLSMPIMDGWEFLNEYKSLDIGTNKFPKLYIFSSSISPHDQERAKSINFVSDFIIKPLLKEKFIEIIENL